MAFTGQALKNLFSKPATTSYPFEPKNYPERSIRKVERKKYGYEVTLNKPNAISLKFTKGGAFIPEDEEIQ